MIVSKAFPDPRELSMAGKDSSLARRSLTGVGLGAVPPEGPPLEVDALERAAAGIRPSWAQPPVRVASQPTAAPAPTSAEATWRMPTGAHQAVRPTSNPTAIDSRLSRRRNGLRWLAAAALCAGGGLALVLLLPGTKPLPAAAPALRTAAAAASDPQASAAARPPVATGAPAIERAAPVQQEHAPAQLEPDHAAAAERTSAEPNAPTGTRNPKRRAKRAARSLASKPTTRPAAPPSAKRGEAREGARPGGLKKARPAMGVVSDNPY